MPQGKIEKGTEGSDNGEPMIVDGRYVLKREIAVGGATRVYAAKHRYVKRMVALKLGRLDVERRDQLFARMRREAETLGILRHPGIVEILDAGETDQAPYIVMELLEGRTLAGLITSRGTLAVSHVVRIGSEVATALQTCHAAGIVHRDIKPSNLFATVNPAAPVKLLDFGIAKVAPEALPSQQKLTQDDAILGTPEYMAPESLLSPADADVRADVYSLAVTLYECLTGAVPFEGNYGEILLKVTTTSPPALTEKRPDVPAELARVIAKGLSRNLADRYLSMVEFRQALETCDFERPKAETDLLGRGLAVPQPTRSAEPDRPRRPTVADSPGAIRIRGPEMRRRFARAPYLTPARLIKPGGDVVDGRVEEVSEGGLLFVGSAPCEPGATVRLRFALPATGRIAEVSAMARWKRAARGAYATGFEFLDLLAEIRSGLQQYVAIMCPPGDTTGSHPEP
jgi:tRNA A-37 threonylcarbamoyl transferase component Bud32